MAIDVDFRKLTLKDALDLAILVEDEARDRYQEFVSQMELHDTPESAGFFRFMAANEAKHGRDLAARRQALFGDEPRVVDATMLYDVEAPEYDAARAFMSPREALDVAMAAERKAWSFFDQALQAIENSEVRALFTELREEEVEHQELVQEQLDKLPPSRAVDPADYVDPPRAL